MSRITSFMWKKWIKDTLNNLLVRIGKGGQRHHLNLGCSSLEIHILNMVREDHIEKLGFKQKLKCEKVRHADTLGYGIPGREDSKSKGPEAWMCFCEREWGVGSVPANWKSCYYLTWGRFGWYSFGRTNQEFSFE